MTLGVVGESWGVVQQTASPGLPFSRASDVARDPQLRTQGVVHAPLHPDVNAADDVWEAGDFGALDEELPEIARATSPPVVSSPPSSVRPAGDGTLPGLLPDLASADGDLPLFKPIRGPAVPIDWTPAVPDALSTEDGADVDEDVIDVDTVESVELPEPIDDDFTVHAGAAEHHHENIADGDDRLAVWDVEDDVDVDLPDFDPDARVDPWIAPQPVDDTALRRARAKAATLAPLLDLSTRREIEAATEYLVDFYVRYSHAATHLALLRLANAGLDLDTLKAMVALRHEWADRPDWWGFRYKGVPSEGGRSAMTWRLAYDVCLNRSEYPPESMIDDDWLEEWRGLRPGTPAYFSFAAMVAEKVGSEAERLLCEGLRHVPGDHRDMPEPGDHHSDLYRANAVRRKA